MPQQIDKIKQAVEAWRKTKTSMSEPLPDKVQKLTSKLLHRYTVPELSRLTSISSSTLYKWKNELRSISDEPIASSSDFATIPIVPQLDNIKKDNANKASISINSKIELNLTGYSIFEISQLIHQIIKD